MRARSWRGEQHGEYQVVRRWRWAAAAARVYEAFHRKTGAPALLLRPGPPGDWQPAPRSWSATVRSTPEQLAVELAPMPRGPVELEEVTLALYRLTGALAQVDTHPAAREALARQRKRRILRPGYVVALAAAVVLAGGERFLEEIRHLEEAAEGGGAAQLAPEAAAAPAAVARRPALAAIARPMPEGPFKGQARPDKQGKCEGKFEHAVNGACWVRVGEAPCDTRSYEHKGGCYLPMYPPLKEPQAALRGEAENP